MNGELAQIHVYWEGMKKNKNCIISNDIYRRIMWKYRLYLFCNYVKYVGIVGLLLAWISDIKEFNWLCLLGLLVFVEIALTYSTFKCSILQIIGMAKANKKYGSNAPDIDSYSGEIRYSLPFEGEWTIVNGCFTKEFSHSWDIPTQRYAYDFIMMDESGKSYIGDSKKVESYYCYDKAILSPADGVVIEIANESDDSLIIGNGKLFSRAKNIAGNYIVIKHSENEFSTLAHLKRDSMVVKVGDRIQRGQKIATCGNTGNSSEPHLHFQVQDGVSFYNSAGLPIRFSDIKLNKQPNYSSIDPRPCMDIDHIPQALITRGYRVSNSMS